MQPYQLLQARPRALPQRPAAHSAHQLEAVVSTQQQRGAAAAATAAVRHPQPMPKEQLVAAAARAAAVCPYPRHPQRQRLAAMAAAEMAARPVHQQPTPTAQMPSRGPLSPCPQEQASAAWQPPVFPKAY